MCHSKDGSIIIETQPRPQPRSSAGVIRRDLVTRVRGAIASGSYESEAAVNGAVSGVVGFITAGSPRCPDCSHPLDPKGSSELTCRNCGSVFQRRLPGAEAA